LQVFIFVMRLGQRWVRKILEGVAPRRSKPYLLSEPRYETIQADLNRKVGIIGMRREDFALVTGRDFRHHLILYEEEWYASYLFRESLFGWSAQFSAQYSQAYQTQRDLIFCLRYAQPTYINFLFYCG